MLPEELKALNKQVKRAKRIATEKASELHDLVEDRLPAAYEDILPMAQECYEACLAWDKARQEFEAAESAMTE